MKKLSLVILIILTLLVVLILGTITASAQATRTEFYSHEVLAPIGPPGKLWVSDGILHIRDLPVSGPVWGELSGTLTVHANLNQDAGGNGNGFGTAYLEVSDFYGMQGAFDGRSQWKYTGGTVSEGQFVGHGVGDFDGMQMMANFFDDNGVTVLTGKILNPHGD